MLFEYTDDDGKVVERVRPAADSPYEEQMIGRAADPATGWAQVDEDTEPEPEPAKPPAKAPNPAKGAPADTPKES